MTSWDSELRREIYRKSNPGDDGLETEDSKKLLHSNMNIFQLMTEEDWKRIESDQFEGQKEFLRTIRRRLLNNCSGKDIQPRNHVLLSDKSIADVVESLIGCHLAQAGQAEAARFLAFIGLGFLPESDIQKVISYDDQDDHVQDRDWFAKTLDSLPKTGLWLLEAYGAGFEDRYVNVQDIMDQLERFITKIDIQSIQEQIGYAFKEKSFLLQALTHASYTINKITESYERLEFLGDAILDYLVTCHLASLFDTLTPGQITDLRSALVNNNTLAEIAVKHKLHAHLLHQRCAKISPDST